MAILGGATVGYALNVTGLGDDSSVVVERGQPSVSTSTKQITEDVPETSKNKKKKKKSGRTAEDVDKILAELGDAPPVSKPSTPTPVLFESTSEEKVQSQPFLVRFLLVCLRWKLSASWKLWILCAASICLILLINVCITLKAFF